MKVMEMFKEVKVSEAMMVMEMFKEYEGLQRRQGGGERGTQLW